MSHPPKQPHFRVRRMLKLGTFHIGSSLSDLLTSAVWNRVMITDLGVTGWVVALLSALRYLLAPLTLWAGYQSDTKPLWGSRRVAYIWLGRTLMGLALLGLPSATFAIAADRATPWGWGLAFASFLLYGVGAQLSGAPFLALVHDSAPYHQRGVAVSIVQIILVVSFAFMAIVYGRLMPDYAPDLFSQLVILGVGGAALFWIFAVWGEEQRPAPGDPAPPAPSVSFQSAFREIWADPRARAYALFLAASACFAFMQDAMLEPFGGDVFGMDAGTTTRFNAYWGTGVLIAMVGTVWATRQRRPDQQVATTAWGLVLLALPLGALSAAALWHLPHLLQPVLVAFGLGFGIFTVGGVSLLMAMSRDDQAGQYMALWSMIQLISRGVGIFLGGVVRDAGLALSGSHAVAYAGLFGIEALGLLLCVWLLRRVDIATFAGHHDPIEVFATATAAD